ncbi:MAG: nucleotide-binding protein [Desulfurococcales archaeon]|nr:nucleotide-binding protein [Desulfurococcales archaeon]
MAGSGDKVRLVIVVDDTGAIIAGLPLQLPAKHLTTERVVEEVRDRESRGLLERAVELGRLQILNPTEPHIKLAKKTARKAGVLRRLSEADISVLALALMVKSQHEGEVLVATDDYSLQSAVRAAGLEYIPIRYRGIGRERPGR